MKEETINAANTLATRCPITVADAADLLEYFKYIEEVNGTKDAVGNSIMELSKFGYKSESIKLILNNALQKYKDIEAWREDPQLNLPNFMESKKQTTFSLKGIDTEDLKFSLKKLNNSGSMARRAGKSFKKLMNNYQRCKFTFKGSECGYDGKFINCDGTFEMCKFLGNEKRFGSFPIQIKQDPIPPEIKRSTTLEIIPTKEFPRPSDEFQKSFNQIKEQIAKKSAVEMEKTYLRLFGNYETSMTFRPEDIYGSGKQYDPSIKNMWIDEIKEDDEIKEFSEKNKIAPKGFSQEEWNILSTKSKRFILNGLGYNKKEKKNFKDQDRAIDL